MNEVIIEKLISKIFNTPEDLYKKYPPRVEKDGFVTRFAPSPTGFIHIGGIFTAMVAEKLARQENGSFFLRIEDTDGAREVEGADILIVEALDYFGIKIDEGENLQGEEIGNYGPYRQSDRKEIYLAFIKHLLEKNAAYPCFCSKEEIESMRGEQEALGERTGYIGKWKKWRDRSDGDILDALDKNLPFVIRYKSNGSHNQKIIINDLIRGRLELRENDHDVVIMKNDGLPTYHFAHVIDDYLMRTTHVLRGDEWISSLPIHIQIFKEFEWKTPFYGHFSPICKMDDGSKRKLSKRKDPEASVDFYKEQGYPAESIKEYLMTLASSSFEDWRRQNLLLPISDFCLSFKHLQKSAGPLFDIQKLSDISKGVVAKMNAEMVLKLSLDWAKNYDKGLFEILEKDLSYTKKVFSVERGVSTQSRKDISKWQDLRFEIGYFFDDLFKDVVFDKNLPSMSIEDGRKVIDAFLKNFLAQDSREVWLEKMRNICVDLGYAQNIKEYKEQPEKYKGNLSHVTNVLRLLLTGRSQSPDLYEIMNVLGEERTKKRLFVIFN